MSPQQDSSKIGVTVATIVGMNAMIGAGIFAVPTALASSVGPAGIITYFFVVSAVWFMAQAIARVAQLYPHEGSFYIYTKQWGGHTAGLIAAGAYLIGLLISMGLLAQMTGMYLQSSFSFLSEAQWGALVLIMLIALNMLGIVISEIGQIILICCTIFPLIATSLLCLTKANIHNLTPFFPHNITNIFSATKIVIFAFMGFECAASLFNVVKNPSRNVPRALTYSIIAVALLYLLFIGSIIVSIPLDYFTDLRTPLTDILEIMFPNNQWVLRTIHFSILSAIIGTLHSMIWSSSTLLLTYFKKINRPIISTLLQSNILNKYTSIIIIGVCIFTSFSTLTNPNLFFSCAAILIVGAYASSMITLLLLPTEWRSGQNIKTIIGLGTASLIIYFAAHGLITTFM